MLEEVKSVLGVRRASEWVRDGNEPWNRPPKEKKRVAMLVGLGFCCLVRCRGIRQNIAPYSRVVLSSLQVLVGLSLC